MEWGLLQIGWQIHSTLTWLVAQSTNILLIWLFKYAFLWVLGVLGEWAGVWAVVSIVVDWGVGVRLIRVEWGIERLEVLLLFFLGVFSYHEEKHFNSLIFIIAHGYRPLPDLNINSLLRITVPVLLAPQQLLNIRRLLRIRPALAQILQEFPERCAFQEFILLLLLLCVSSSGHSAMMWDATGVFTFLFVLGTIGFRWFFGFNKLGEVIRDHEV